MNVKVKESGTGMVKGINGGSAKCHVSRHKNTSIIHLFLEVSFPTSPLVLIFDRIFMTSHMTLSAVPNKCLSIDV